MYIKNFGECIAKIKIKIKTFKQTKCPKYRIKFIIIFLDKFSLFININNQK